MDKLLSILEASKLLGISRSTLRRWEREGKIKPDARTNGNQRRYKLSSIRPEICHKDTTKKKTLAYARVSAKDQQKDLVRQKELLELFCSSNGWEFELISDLGSGMNYRKRGLQNLIRHILDNSVQRLVITHKDRLLRFGSELVFSICEAKNVEVVIINQGENTASFEEDLAKDVLEIITVFSARLYGSRSHKNKKLLEDLAKVSKDASRAQNRAKAK
jgi:excisionase family DNA binding protein